MQMHPSVPRLRIQSGESQWDSVMPDSFVVCGATGNQGGAVVEALLRRGLFRVWALVRNPRAPESR